MARQIPIARHPGTGLRARRGSGCWPAAHIRWSCRSYQECCRKEDTILSLMGRLTTSGLPSLARRRRAKDGRLVPSVHQGPVSGREQLLARAHEISEVRTSAVICATPLVSPITSTGRSTVLIPTAIWNVPLSTWPDRFPPQHFTAPTLVSAHVSPPTADLDHAARQPNHINGRCLEKWGSRLQKRLRTGRNFVGIPTAAVCYKSRPAFRAVRNWQEQCRGPLHVPTALCCVRQLDQRRAV